MVSSSDGKARNLEERGKAKMKKMKRRGVKGGRGGTMEKLRSGNTTPNCHKWWSSRRGGRRRSTVLVLVLARWPANAIVGGGDGRRSSTPIACVISGHIQIISILRGLVSGYVNHISKYFFRLCDITISCIKLDMNI